MALDTLDATISRVVFHGPSKWNPSGVPFAILKLHNGSIAQGNMRRPEPGLRVRFWGEWRPQKGYDDPAFQFESFEEVLDQSVSGTADYLARHIDGLGKVKSAALVESLGADTLAILRTTPERAADVPGITESIVQAIRSHFADPQQFDPAAYAKLIDLFSGHRVRRSVIKRLLRDWMSDAPKKVVECPYLLLDYPGMGWKSVDAFATSTAGYDPAGLDRQKAAIVEAMERLSQQGHTVSSRYDADALVFELIDRQPSAESWAAVIAGGDVVAWPDQTGATNTASLAKLDAAESSIALRLADLATHAKPMPVAFETDGLSESQAAALHVIAKHGVCLLVGPPGTGKTFTVTKALAALVGGGVRSIRIVTPTGKAAKRATELLEGKLPVGTDIPCTTIHRALGPVPSDAAEGASKGEAKPGRGRDEFGFSRNAEKPLEVDVLICDETSMIDVRLADALLTATANGTRVVFVGDQNQLPSVGPGSFLRDMMDAGVPTAQLTEIRRNSGRIVRACHAIKDGRLPEPADRVDFEAGDNWIHVEMSDPQAIAEHIVGLHKPYKAFPDPMWDMQVITPQRTRLAVACDYLNLKLSEHLNPQLADRRGAVGGQDDGEDGAPPVFRQGDKVIRRKNGLCDQMTTLTPDDIADGRRVDWRWGDQAWAIVETDVVNGDLGTVQDITRSGDDVFIVVEFRTPRRLCRLPFEGCHLQLAYAITVHSAQGSGFPYVVLPVHSSFYWDNKTNTGLMSRELVYTAFSRAERLLVTVGEMAAIRAAVGRKTVHQRRTSLAGKIREVWASGGGNA